MNKLLFLLLPFFIYTITSEFTLPSIELPADLQESIESLHSQLFSPDFHALRHSIESPLNIDHYQHFYHPQMNSRSPNYFEHPGYHRSYDSPSSGYEGHRSRANMGHRPNEYLNHRPKPSYPKAYSKVDDGRFNRRTGVPDEEIKRRLQEGDQDEKKRVLYAGDSLEDKEKEIKGRFDYVFFGNEQPLITYWMELLQKVFNDAEIKDFSLYFAHKQELSNLGIEVKGAAEEALLQGCSCEFHILEYEKEIDPHYVPTLRMFVPYLGFRI